MADNNYNEIEQEQHVDSVSLKLFEYLIEDVCDKEAQKSPEEIHMFLETIGNKNMRSFLEKEILERLGQKKK